MRQKEGDQSDFEDFVKFTLKNGPKNMDETAKELYFSERTTYASVRATKKNLFLIIEGMLRPVPAGSDTKILEEVFSKSLADGAGTLDSANQRISDAVENDQVKVYLIQ